MVSNNCYVSLTEVAVKHCEKNGSWELTADMNETLTNYSMCYAFSAEKMKVGSISDFSIW